jgi:hypothetical protein
VREKKTRVKPPLLTSQSQRRDRRVFGERLLDQFDLVSFVQELPRTDFDVAQRRRCAQRRAEQSERAERAVACECVRKKGPSERERERNPRQRHAKPFKKTRATPENSGMTVCWRK